MRKARMIPAAPVVFLLLVLAFFTACSSSAARQGEAGSGDSEGWLKAVATTTLVGDVVRAVGGDRVDVTVLIPAGVDEHAYEPTAREVATASDADLIFINGAGLEPFIERMMSNAGGKAGLVSVSDSVPLLKGHGAEDVHEGEGGDPHVWTDPNNVLVWVDAIEKALSKADPQNTETYQENAAAYRNELKALDVWIQKQVAEIPPNKRLLVTDHMVFTYFASRYGFEQVGAIVPGYSTAAAPSAQELAALENTIHDLNVPAIFVGNTVNQDLAERVTQDTGTQLVEVLTGSLTQEDGPAPTYLDYMRYNVNAIVSALK